MTPAESDYSSQMEVGVFDDLREVGLPEDFIRSHQCVRIKTKEKSQENSGPDTQVLFYRWKKNDN